MCFSALTIANGLQQQAWVVADGADFPTRSEHVFPGSALKADIPGVIPYPC